MQEYHDQKSRSSQSFLSSAVMNGHRYWQATRGQQSGKKIVGPVSPGNTKQNGSSSNADTSGHLKYGEIYM